MKLAGSIAVLAVLVSVRPAMSQVSVYGDFSAAQLTNSQGTNSLYGPTFGVSADLVSKHHLALAGDLRGGLVFGNGEQFDSLAVGPHIAVEVGKFSPYVEAMIGFARYNNGLKSSSASTDAVVEGVVGLDRRVANRVDWRIVDFEYQQFYAIGSRVHPYTFGTGLVVHLGKR